ncbi:MAG: GNAT family N-acetyltransferase [Thermomonas sp.]
MNNTIKHDPESNRFNTVVDGVTGYVEYELAGNTMTLTHTIVPPAIGGRGIASELVKTALDHARAEGLKVVPQCSYADSWMRKHPEYEDLRA